MELVISNCIVDWRLEKANLQEIQIEICIWEICWSEGDEVVMGYSGALNLFLTSSQLQANPIYLMDSTVVLPVQINGKTRGTIQVEKTCTEEDAFQIAEQDEKLSKYLTGQSIKKRIFVPGKILNVILDRQSSKVARW